MAAGWSVTPTCTRGGCGGGQTGLLLCATGGAALVVIATHLRCQPWAPLRAELAILRVLVYEGICRIFRPCDSDGTDALTWRERVQRVRELWKLLALERNHQIDVARRALFGHAGWGRTSGTHHMRHLPALVFRGEDSATVQEALDRADRLSANPLESRVLRLEWEKAPFVKDVVLVGGGHAHVHLLRMTGMEALPGVRFTLIARDVETPYSGMLPGHVAGTYARPDCHLDLNALARFAHVRLVHATAVGLDLENRRVLLGNGRPPIAFDVLSINVGSAPQLHAAGSAGGGGGAAAGEAEGVTPVKPIDTFGLRWEALLAKAASWEGRRRLVVVGGGAGGFELAVGMGVRLRKELEKCGGGAELEVTLLTRSGLMPQHTPGVRALATQALADRNVTLVTGCEVERASGGVLYCKKTGGDCLEIGYDDCVWCTEGRPQAWVQDCGLATDDGGFLLVDQQMRCRSRDGQDCGTIFAAGDVASIEGHPRPKAGVFAVMAGMALWVNIRATLLGERPVTYWPQESFLGLLGLGDCAAIASRGTLAIEGRWLWDLKDWIDKRWMWNYLVGRGLPDMEEDAGAGAPASGSAAARVASAAGGNALDLLRHSTMRCGGCGAKVGATTLSQAMARVDMPRQPAERALANVLVGAGDDAAVVELATDGEGGGKVASVQTVDFFRSFIGDPYVFGRIAAVHALSDCEAMGAIPQTALAVVQVPHAAESKQEEDLVQLMSGACSAIREAGCALVGGHTCEAAELGLGFSVTGRLVGGGDQALLKTGLKPGYLLVLTKPIGTGALFAADMRAKARGPWVAAALQVMQMSNGQAGSILRAHGATACTDITGFGLVGHALEMCRGSGARVALELDSIPLYEGALECVQMGITSSLQPANTRLRRAVSNHEEARSRPAYPLLFDPQTAGGLFAAVPQAFAEDAVVALRSSGVAPHAAVVGRVMDLRADGGDGGAAALEVITVL